MTDYFAPTEDEGWNCCLGVLIPPSDPFPSMQWLFPKKDVNRRGTGKGPYGNVSKYDPKKCHKDGKN